jgi:hypothetical protein
LEADLRLRSFLDALRAWAWLRPQVATRYSSVENGAAQAEVEEEEEAEAEAERESRRWREEESAAAVVWGATRGRGRIWRCSMVAAADGKPPLVGGLKRFCCSERGQRLEQNKDRANRFKKKEEGYSQSASAC